MSDNTYWGTVPSSVHIVDSGEHEDNFGTDSDLPAIWMGEALIEGTVAEWRAFAASLVQALDEYEARPDVEDEDEDDS